MQHTSNYLESTNNNDIPNRTQTHLTPASPPTYGQPAGNLRTPAYACIHGHPRTPAGNLRIPAYTCAPAYGRHCLQ
eukprot:5168059-Lingulodinium_polyedra.AAC.1